MHFSLVQIPFLTETFSWTMTYTRLLQVWDQSLYHDHCRYKFKLSHDLNSILYFPIPIFFHLGHSDKPFHAKAVQNTPEHQFLPLTG